MGHVRKRNNNIAKKIKNERLRNNTMCDINHSNSLLFSISMGTTR